MAVEQTLKDSELRYRRLFETAQDGILILDAKTGMIEDVNPYLIEMLGYSREEFVKRKLWEVGAFRDIEASKNAFEVLQDREYIRYEDLPLKTKDGRLVQVEFVSNVYLVGAEKVIQCNIRDNTEHKRIVTALQANERKYHDLLNQSSDGIFIIDLTGNILTVNSAMCRELEFSEDEFLSMQIWDVIPEQYLHEYRERLTKILAGEIFEKPGEYEVRGKDGRNHYVEILSTPHYYGADIVGFQGIAHDITARKRAEESVRASEGLMNYIVRHDPNAIAVFDRNLHYIAVSDRFVQDYELKEQDIIGKHHYEVFPEMPQKWKDVHRRCLDGAIERNDNDSFERPDGSITYNRWECRPWHKENGEIGGIITYTEVTTERKQAEEQTRFQASLLNAVGQAIIATDAAGTVTYVNRAAEILYGWLAEETRGHTILEVTVPQVSQIQAEEIMAHLSRGESWSGEFLVQHRDGGVFPAEVHDSPIFNHENELIGIIGISSDITKRRQAEEILREKERLLSEAQFIGRMGSLSYDITTGALQFSEEMYRLLDTSLQEFQHDEAGFLGLIYASDRPQVTQWIAQIKTGRRVKELDFRLIRKDGELRYLQSRGEVLFDPDGNPARFIGTGQDISERKLAEIQIRQQIQRLTALGKIDQAIISAVNLDAMLEIFLAQVVSQLQVDAADVLLLPANSETLDYLAGRGFRTQAAEETTVPVGKSVAGRVAKERRLIRIEDLQDQSRHHGLSERLAGEGFVSYFGVPLITKGKVKGVLEVFHRAALYPYAEWVDFLHTLAGQAAIAIENLTLFTNLEQSNRELLQAYDATIVGWSRALDLRDQETEGHTLRVTELTLKLASKFDFTESEMLHIRWGALLHDIGKLGIPDSILLKPGELSKEEWAIMRKHPQYSHDLLQPIAFLLPALDIPYCHHEKWDGTGYPRGLKEEEIPRAVRVFSVVDVWDALCADRPYRAGWPQEKVRDYILSQSGKYFDPQIVDAFLRLQI